MFPPLTSSCSYWPPWSPWSATSEQSKPSLVAALPGKGNLKNLRMSERSCTVAMAIVSHLTSGDLLVPEPNKKIDSLKSAVDGVHSSLIRIIRSGNATKSSMNSSDRCNDRSGSS